MSDQPQQPGTTPPSDPPSDPTAPPADAPVFSAPPPADPPPVAPPAPEPAAPPVAPPAPPQGQYPPAAQGQYPPAPQGQYAPPPQGQYPPQGQAPAYPQGGVVPLSQQDEKLYSTLTHLSPLILSFVGPLIAYLIWKDKGPFIRHHAAQALNFQIIVAIASVALIIVTAITLGIGAFLYFPLGIAALVFMVMAAVAANKGEWYRYPLTPDWIK